MNKIHNPKPTTWIQQEAEKLLQAYQGSKIIRDRTTNIDYQIDDNEIFLSPNQAAEFLGVSHQFIREKIARRDIPSFKVGRLVKVEKSKLKAWLIKNRR